MTRVVTFEQAQELTGQIKHWAYNAADTTGTRQIADTLLPRIQGRKATVYNASRAFQNVSFGIMRRGILVDQERRRKVIKQLEGEIETALAAVANMPVVRDLWDGEEMETGECPTPQRKDSKHKWEPWLGGRDQHGRHCVACGAHRYRYAPFNANSVDQVYHLLYDLLELPEEKNKKGVVCVDEEVLYRMQRKHPRYAELIGWEPNEDEGKEGAGILHVRSLKKQLGEVKAPLSAGGRYMTTINIGTAWTGRSSSSKNARGLGGNTQNKAERIRPMFIADPGYEMGNADYMQAESLDLAYEAEDEAYIEAHKEDLHTYVTRIIFPDLPWVWDIKADKEIAKKNPPWDSAPGHNYRFYTKRNSHGYGYGVSPQGTARIVHGKEKDAKVAHAQLDEAFPNIKQRYHARIRERIRQGLPIVTPLGREIPLMGRPWDSATWRQGYSASPQATVSDLVWIAMYLIYRDHDPHFIQMLGNGYDAMLCQWPVGRRDEAVKIIVDAMTIPVDMPGDRTMTIGVEVAAGKNWGKADPKTNPNGLEDVYP